MMLFFVMAKVLITLIYITFATGSHIIDSSSIFDADSKSSLNFFCEVRFLRY